MTERQQLLIVHPHNITVYSLNEAQYGDFYTERQSIVNLPQYENCYTDWTTAYRACKSRHVTCENLRENSLPGT